MLVVNLSFYHDLNLIRKNNDPKIIVIIELQKMMNLFHYKKIEQL